ncbi:DUF4174 domain-containing protein [Halospina sp. K52047b]|uniref:DUF4174 domain-containing protein n=1 Tax=Halospina sp. K52047b TaxID=2614160 RepID=UPI00124A3B53|nr:DUF4174 domain-containing protein [Halospina sp. K52047b]KAA8985514.1 DUF4174 domain-containing protein [Halospina sp. K52047b]
MKWLNEVISRPAVLALGLLWFGPVIAGEQGMRSLSDFQWRNRLILVEGANEPDQRVETLRRHAAGIDDRDIVWFVVGDQGIQSNLEEPGRDLQRDVRKTLDAQPENVSVVLIGKDGGIKQRSQGLDVAGIFALIDTMPMRKREKR